MTVVLLHTDKFNLRSKISTRAGQLKVIFCAQFLTGRLSISHLTVIHIFTLKIYLPCLVFDDSPLTSRYALRSVDCITIGSTVDCLN